MLEAREKTPTWRRREMVRRLLVSVLVAVGLCGGLTGFAAAQATGATEWGILGFGPGVAGNVIVGPIRPICQPDVPCEQPLVGASVQVFSLGDDRKEHVVGLAVTNTLGNFVVSVPPGDYLVHVETEFLPQCEDVKVSVGKKWFASVTIDCDTGLR
jgi:hypothetical protein